MIYCIISSQRNEKEQELLYTEIINIGNFPRHIRENPFR